MAPFEPGDAAQRSVSRRQARARLKGELSRLERDIVATFDHAQSRGDPVLSGLRVDWFLRSVPGVGPTKATRILERHGINPRATLGGLRTKQRAALRDEVVQLAMRVQTSTRQGIVVVIAGPTAVGKHTVIERVRQTRPDIVMSVSATTRRARPGEVDGEDYFFVSDKEFDRLVRDGELLEWATVHGAHRYGTPREPVLREKKAGKTVFLEIDVQGARQIRESGIEALFVFIAPPTFDALAQRLETRGTEDEAERQRRLATAVEELGARSEFDVVIVNDVVETAAREVVDLLEAYTPRGD